MGLDLREKCGIGVGRKGIGVKEGNRNLVDACEWNKIFRLPSNLQDEMRSTTTSITTTHPFPPLLISSHPVSSPTLFPSSSTAHKNNSRPNLSTLILQLQLQPTQYRHVTMRLDINSSPIVTNATDLVSEASVNLSSLPWPLSVMNTKIRCGSWSSLSK